MIDCRSIAANRKMMIGDRIADLNIPVGLLVIQVGNNPASNSYIKGKRADCEEVGIVFHHMHYDTDVTTETIIEFIELVNQVPDIHGIIVQLPLPPHLDKEKILNTIADEKDVDGFKSTSKFTPCTPLGIKTILNSIGVNVDGKVCCVIGRGEVGRPMVDLLTKNNATVIWCNSHTYEDDMKFLVQTSDIVISATGVPSLIKHIDDQVVIDVGITRGEDGKLYGDVDKCCYGDDKLITPVPGGVGLMTRVALLENTLEAAIDSKRRRLNEN